MQRVDWDASDLGFFKIACYKRPILPQINALLYRKARNLLNLRSRILLCFPITNITFGIMIK